MCLSQETWLTECVFTNMFCKSYILYSLAFCFGRTTKWYCELYSWEERASIIKGGISGGADTIGIVGRDVWWSSNWNVVFSTCPLSSNPISDADIVRSRFGSNRCVGGVGLTLNMSSPSLLTGENIFLSVLNIPSSFSPCSSNW